MATITAASVRTIRGTAVLATLILVLAFGNQAYVDWAHEHTSNGAWGFFLRELSWPAWSFSTEASIRTLLANDLKAILLIILAGVFATVLAGHLTGPGFRLFVGGWASYLFAGALAGFLAEFVQSASSLLGAFHWAAEGVTYGLFVGWIVGLATFLAKH